MHTCTKAEGMSECKEWLDLEALVFSDEIETFLAQHCNTKTDPVMSDDMDEDKPSTSQEANIWDVQLRTGNLFHIVPRKIF